MKTKQHRSRVDSLRAHGFVKNNVRDQIISSAKSLLVRRGYGKMIIEDIAREAGIGKGSVYLHFRSKEDVVLAIIDAEVQTVLASLRLIADENESAEERLGKMLVQRVLGRFDRFREFSTSLHDLLAAARPALVQQRDYHLGKELRLFARVLDEGIESRVFIPLDAAAVASALLTATNGLLPYYLNARELGARAHLQRRVTVIADLARRAVVARPSHQT